MTHLPPENLLGLDALSQSQTLFLPAPGTQGVLITRKGAKQREQVKRFRDARAALAWCEAKRVALVYFFDPAPAQN